MKKNRWQNSRQIYAWLKAQYGIPQAVLNEIRVAIAQDAAADGEGLAYDRFLTMLAVALNRRHHWGEKRITDIITDIFQIADDVNTGKVTMQGLMKEIADNTGLIIRTDRDGVVGDYFAENERDAN